MSSKIFLQALQNKLKGGNSRSIHLNALPGRFATRLDLRQLDLVDDSLSEKFLSLLLNRSSFEFGISFDALDLNEHDQASQKKLGLISKRLNAIIIENEDYFKEHGTKTLGFGYPILIRRSTKDPSKIIKAPLFIWPLDAIKSESKVNEWTIFRNKVLMPNGQLAETDIHGVSINEVLLSFIKGEDDILLPGLNPEVLDDMLVDPEELLSACSSVLSSLNAGSESQHLDVLKHNFKSPINVLPEAGAIDDIANNKAYIHFGGVFGLFRTQKESIISDISRLIERFSEFQFDSLKVDNLSDTPFSAVSTDPAQQAIIGTLGMESNQIIQGPPGTGKSQSLTALVTNALGNGLKCLVVCEKKTALDVIKRNIERTHEPMAQLVAVIDDVNEDREAIVDSVRERQNALPAYQHTIQTANLYGSTKDKLRTVTQAINTQHLALAKPVYDHQNWNQLVGRFLKLRNKFTELPLRHDLKKDNFRFLDDPSQFKAILTCLGKANNLYSSAAPYAEIFKPLSDQMFQGKSVGEARIILEDFVSNVKNKAKEIQHTIDRLQQVGKEAVGLSAIQLPKAVFDEILTHLPYLEGTDLSNGEFPEVFALEQDIQKAITALQVVQQNGQQVRKVYTDGLVIHYNDYRETLSKALKSYLKFIDDQHSAYGQEFFANTKFARFKTNLLSIFSDKHKQIKLGRLEVINRIAGIRSIQHKKNYLNHSYNDELISTDLSIYPANIRLLQEESEKWFQGVTEKITSYISHITSEHNHPDFSSVGVEFGKIIGEYDIAISSLTAKGLLEQSSSPLELNSLIATIPETTAQLKRHLNGFESHRTYHRKIRNQYAALTESIQELTTQDELRLAENPYLDDRNLDFASTCVRSIEAFAKTIETSLHHFRTYFEWRNFYLSCTKTEQSLIDTLISKSNRDWVESFECWHLFWVLTQNEPQHLPKDDYDIHLYQKLKGEFDGSQLNNIMAKWLERQVGAVRMFKAKGMGINSLFNKKGAKGMRRNSLRTIVKSEFELFTDFYPVVLLNPSVCSSIIPLEEGIFDLIIFDEASQLRLEDTYAALVRGKAKIVSGDKHQMAPSSYFEGSAALLDPIEDEVEGDEEPDSTVLSNKTNLSLADSESLLAYAVDRNFKESYLTVHYRSQHPYLIDFSNHAFYGKRLIPVPAKKDYVPIVFQQVNGIYENSTNRKEALSVIAILKDKVVQNPEGTYPSVGVATFNLYQRNLILEEIGAERRISPDFDNVMAKLGDSFFVKNLENIQGDERDIIIISTTFGDRPNGTFSQSFGPIIQGKGHRMLNVIITRAKVKVYICCSIPEESIGQYPQLIQRKGNKGRGILYAYLAYAKAVSASNEDQRLGILNLLSQYCTDQYYDRAESGLGSESPFEDEVYNRLIAHIDPARVEQQFKVGGFRIDIVVHPTTPYGKRIAIECDGAKYHTSPEAYAWDIFRQQQLEKFGFEFHRIWSTKWWDSADRELESLLTFIKNDGTADDKGQASLFADNTSDNHI
ncbi:AAA domain-containing protein [Pedobacter sp. GR22-10]|uniref:AAA domain-containing protein n=1 Tax=Pedobacter sp. GR22-10 TaxID=2994472 RepID=UPI00224639A0|nr:AAA domain-containing protein [Pedobacter sp. GR22-10]MCX2430905.1 AAA domain-containing protein [Pedobacter sp. GR22-10]